MTNRRRARAMAMCSVTIALPEKVLKLYVAAAARRHPTLDNHRRMTAEELISHVACNVALRGSIWQSSLYNSRELEIDGAGEAPLEAQV